MYINVVVVYKKMMTLTYERMNLTLWRACRSYITRHERASDTSLGGTAQAEYATKTVKNKVLMKGRSMVSFVYSLPETSLGGTGRHRAGENRKQNR